MVSPLKRSEPFSNLTLAWAHILPIPIKRCPVKKGFSNGAIFLTICFLPFIGYAKVRVITTTTNLKSLVEAVGGDKVEVDSLSKGTQDPHYVEAKPSFTLKVSKADLLVSEGLGLEVGWLPLILRGARNPKLQSDDEGNFVAGNYIEALEKPTTAVTRADGDVHPEGNPHFLLDPANAITVAEKLKERLQKIDAASASEYEKNYKVFSQAMGDSLAKWKKRIKVGTKVVTYHKTLTYFYNRFGIDNVGLLEPKPGIPPSAKHILDVIKKASKEGVNLVLVENYFDPTVAHRVAKDVKNLRVEIAPVSVGGEPNISNLFDLYERLVSAFEKR
jgi:ABC-type Zn uptake system ZnuABC Zn-binding protein ZnuA